MKSSLWNKIAAVAVGVGISWSVQAQQEVKIGVIYPLTGPGAAVGAELRNALELAADVINLSLIHI